MKNTLKKSEAGLSFAIVAKALGEGMHNISSHELREGGEVEEFLREHGLTDAPHVFMATHSIGDRDWTLEEGRKPAFYEESCFNGGWHVIREEDASYLYCSSATSGSSLSAEKQRDGTWTVTLEVPIGDDGQPYQGYYWKYFHQAILGEQKEATKIRGCEDDDAAVASDLIRVNLERFGIVDMTVTGVLNGRDGRRLGHVEMSLSDICGLRYDGLAKNLEIEPKNVELVIKIEADGVVIGKVDSDGGFDYEAAPDFRTALGWKIATDGGQVQIIESFDLDQAARSILEIVQSKGTSKDAFFGPFFEMVKQVFVCRRTSRFGDGYCIAATMIWHVATRQLGEEHPGYPFCY